MGQPEPEPEPEPQQDENWHRAQAMFRMVDADGSGSLDREEVRMLGEQLGTPLVESELDAAMRAMDEDGSGSVDFEEFYEWWKAVNQREVEGKGVWAEEDEVQPAEPAPPSAPASPAPHRGGGRRRGDASPTAPHSPAPERGAARRTKPATPSEPGVSIEESSGPETSSDEPRSRRIQRLLLWCRPRRKKTEREECRELFDQIDEDGSGLLDISELVKLAKLLGVTLTPDQAQVAMDEIDDDKSGEIDFEEFFMWFKRMNQSETGHCDSKLGKASIRWAEDEQRRAVVRASAQRSSSVLSRATAPQRTVEEMRTLHGLAREKAG